MSKKVIFQDLESIDYQECWDYQNKLFQKNVQTKLSNRKENKNKPTTNYLLFCEHPHVYTLGKSGDKSHLLIDEQKLKDRNAKYYKIDRGGDITYHGPGQLVVYPILDLDHFFTDIHKYLRYLEEAVIETLSEFGIKTGRIDGLTGVWTTSQNNKPAKKICAMGVRCSRWVTMHGLALNINPDLSYFNNIVPCGISDKAVTSMKAELVQEVSMLKVKEILLKKLTGLFEFEIVHQ